MEKKKGLKVTFDTSLYSPSSIKEAIKEYNDLACFALKKSSGRIEVCIENVSEGLRPRFKQEFCNYVLALEGMLK